MKYILLLCDGMADEPIEEFNGMTPLEYAKTPNMDKLSKKSIVGLCKTVPDGMKPGSDTANLSVLGYDPKKYYSGRSPLEALSIGVNMKDTDVALRMNFVTLTEDESSYEDKKIIDHSAGEISTEEAALLLDAIKDEFQCDQYKFYLGVSYRHLLIWDKGEVLDFTQPHDILGEIIGDKLPKNVDFYNMMKKSYDILKDHPVNIKRKNEGKNPANSIWFWGAGTRPSLSSFTEKTKLKGSMISAVDLLKGIAFGTGMDIIEVEGANGGLHTNYEGKASACTRELLENNKDFVYLHIEATDEMGHKGDEKLKVEAIENIDSRVLEFILNKMEKSGEDFKILIVPDHPTPVRIRTHTGEMVPFLLYDSRKEENGPDTYNEKTAKETGVVEGTGHLLIERLFN